MKFYRYLSIGIVLCTLMANVGITFAEAEMLPFTDVTLDNPNLEAISALKEKGIIGGYPDGTFKPNQVVNRAEALKMIYGIKDLKTWGQIKDTVFDIPKDVSNVKVPFKDIDKNAWYFQYLQRAINDGVIEGYPDNTFKPEQTVNTVENLKMLLEYTFLREGIDSLGDGQAIIEAPFNDVELNQWYTGYAVYAAEKDIIKGDNKNNIYPSEGMTRGKLAQAIYNLYVEDEKYIPTYSVYPNAEMTKYDVQADDHPIATLPDEISEKDISEFNGKKAEINKVGQKNVYISVCIYNGSSYNEYGNSCNGNTYSMDRESAAVTNADSRTDKPVELDFIDASPDDMWTVWTSTLVDNKNIDIKIYILPTQQNPNGKVKTYDIDKKYGQFGDIKFSPDGKKLAYAAIVGDYYTEFTQLNDQYTAVYTLDIATGIHTLVEEGHGQLSTHGDGSPAPYRIKGWKDNDTLEYQYSWSEL